MSTIKKIKIDTDFISEVVADARAHRKRRYESAKNDRNDAIHKVVLARQVLVRAQDKCNQAVKDLNIAMRDIICYDDYFPEARFSPETIPYPEIQSVVGGFVYPKEPLKVVL